MMLVNELLRMIEQEKINGDAPVLFVGQDGGWSNVDVKYLNGELCVSADYTRPFSGDN